MMSVICESQIESNGGFGCWRCKQRFLCVSLNSEREIALSLSDKFSSEKIDFSPTHEMVQALERSSRRQGNARNVTNFRLSSSFPNNGSWPIICSKVKTGSTFFSNEILEELVFQ